MKPIHYKVGAGVLFALGAGLVVYGLVSRAPAAPAAQPDSPVIDSTATDPNKRVVALTDADRAAARAGIGADGKATARNGAVAPR